MANERRIYQLKHALHCNKTVGPSLIQHWAHQNYLVHGTERRGSVERLTFSFPELVYLSFVVRLSWFGAVTKETVVHYAASSPRDVVSARLNEAKLIFDQFCTHKWKRLVTVKAVQNPLEGATARSKKSAWYYHVSLNKLDNADEQFMGWLEERGCDATAFINTSKVKDGVKEALGVT